MSRDLASFRTLTSSGPPNIDRLGQGGNAKWTEFQVNKKMVWLIVNIYAMVKR